MAYIILKGRFKMFENFYKEVNEYNNAHKPQIIKNTPPSATPALNKSVLLKTINDIPNMDKNELESFIARNFEKIINGAYDSQTPQEYLKWFTNIDFLDVFINTLHTRFIDTDIIIRINKLCYDYIALDKNKQSPAVVSRMIRISNIINQAYIPKLLGLGLNNNIASYIMIARFSHFDPNIYVKRVNYILLTLLNNSNNIYDLLLAIFRVIYANNISRIFQYVMHDISCYDINGIRYNWVTPDIEEIDSNINLVILELLNEQPTDVIAYTLRSYFEYTSICNKPVRFSMKTISGDYDRIRYIIGLLYTKGINII